MELTGKQTRHLRSLGQRLSASVIIGREGLTDEVCRQISAELDRRELVKVRLPAGADRRALAAEAAAALGAALAGVVGRTALLYRPSAHTEDPVSLPEGSA